MPDTVRTNAAVLALLASNARGAISAQDLRDAFVTLFFATGTPTRASVSASPPAQDGCSVYCVEVDARYRYDATSTAIIDGWRVLGVSTGIGRWVLVGDTISLWPLGGGLDDRPRLVGSGSAGDAMAYFGRVLMRNGAWTIATAAQMKSGTKIHAEGPGVVITSTLTQGAGGFVNFVFWKFAQIPAVTTTLSATPPFGAKTITVASAGSLSVGQWIWVGQTAATSHSFLSSQYQIKNIAGTTVTLDRAIQFPFVSGDEVRIIIEQVRDIELNGNGATLKGSGDRLIEFTGAYRCHIRDWYTPKPVGALPGTVVSLDIGSLESTIEDCTCDAGGSYGYLLESSERCAVIRCHADNVGGGIVFYDSANCVAEDCHTTQNNAGIQLTSNLMTVGCYNCVVRGGSFNQGPNVGIAFEYATDCRIIGAIAENNAVGIDTGASSVRTRIIGCKTARNTTYGVHQRAVGTRIIGHAGNGDTYTVACFQGCDITEPDFHEYTFGVYIDAGIPAKSLVNVRGGRLRSTVAGGSNCMRAYGAAIIVFDGTKFENAASDSNQSCTVQVGGAGSVLILRDIVAVQTTASNGAVIQAGETLRIEGRVDFAALATPIANSGGYVSLGTVVANGAAGVDVIWPDIKTTDHVTLTRKTDGGTPGPTPRVDIVAGTKFTITGAAGDTSTYEYRVA